MLRVVLASRNAGKAREFGRLLGSLLSVEVLPAGVTLPEETGATFAENARLKAREVFAALEGAVSVLADDSGLEVVRLDGRPGVLSARFAGDSASDGDNVTRLLAELGREEDRSARFVCSLCLVMAGGAERSGEARIVEAEGRLQGQITWSPRGQDGFGYDPVFLPLGWGSTLAEVDPVEKDEISHRGAASRKLLRRLLELGALNEEG